MSKGKKYFFIIASIIQVIASVLTIVNAKAINASKMAMLESYPEFLREKMESIYQNMGVATIIASAAICIIVSLGILLLASKEKVAQKKGLVIVLFVVAFLFAPSTIAILTALVGLIITATIKKEESDSKKEMPVLEKEKVDKKKIILAVALIIFYFSVNVGANFITNPAVGIFVAILFYCAMIAFSILIFKDVFKEGFKQFIKNFGPYCKFIIPKFLIFTVLFLIVNIICMFLVNARGENQQMLEQLPLWLSFPLAVIYAPIVEETLFRGCLRRFIANDKVFIVISGIVFGLLHTVFAETNIVNLFVLAIPYGFMGAFFAWLYVKTNNMMSNIFCHFINNFFAMIASAAAATIFIWL